MTCELEVGHPINVTNGNMYLEATDAEVPSDLGLPLSLKRHYNSLGTGNGMLGVNWRFGLEHSIAVDTVTGNVTLTEATGRQVLFQRHQLEFGSPTVTYDAPYGIPYRLAVSAGLPAFYTVSLPDNSKLIFKGQGPVDSLEDLAGNEIKFFYTGSVLDSARNASLRKVVFKYRAADGLLDTIKSATGSMLVHYEYDTPTNRLKRAVYADGTWERYIYLDPPISAGQLILTDTTSDGASRHYAYDSAGLATHFDRGGGKEAINLNWDILTYSGCAGSPNAYRCSVSYASGPAMATYDFVWSPDWTRRVVTSRQNSDCAGCATTYSYDGNGMKRSVAHANGTVDSIAYDMRGNMVSRTTGANTSVKQRTQWRFDSSFNRPTREARPSVAKTLDSARVTYGYDTDGNLTTLMETGWLDSLNSYTYTSTFHYNDSGQMIWADGPRQGINDTIRYTYYGNGDLRHRILPNKDTTEFGQRNEIGRRTWVRSPNGDITRYTFDNRGRLTKVVYASGSVTDSTAFSLAYNVDGQVASISNLDGSGLTMLHDPGGYLTDINDKAGSLIRYTYDAFGNPARSLSE